MRSFRVAPRFSTGLHATKARFYLRVKWSKVRTSLYVEEKSDEAIVLAKRLNKGRQLPAEVVEGRASPKGEQPLGGRGSDTEPKCRVDPNNGCGGGGQRGQNVHLAQ